MATLPNNVNKYQLAKIYKIISNCCDDIYIGASCEPTLAKRLANHRGNFKNYKKGIGHYISSYKLLSQSHYEIILIEIFPCNSKDELNKRERFHIENTDNCVNMNIPSRKNKEYYKDNKSTILQQKKQYYKLNKEKIINNTKEYYKTNADYIKNNKKINKYICECGRDIQKNGKYRHEKTKIHKKIIKEIIAMMPIGPPPTEYTIDIL